jgi:hypothetical protein
VQFKFRKEYQTLTSDMMDLRKKTNALNERYRIIFLSIPARRKAEFLASYNAEYLYLQTKYQLKSNEIYFKNFNKLFPKD